MARKVTRAFRTITAKGDLVSEGTISDQSTRFLFWTCLTRFGSCIGSVMDADEHKTWVFSRCVEEAGECNVQITSVWEE